MSNYRDPCEDLGLAQDPTSQGEAPSENVGTGGTVFPWTVTESQGTGGADSDLQIILPGTASGASLSAVVEFGPDSPDGYSSRLVFKPLRETHMYLQQDTYNFSRENKLAGLQSSRTEPSPDQIRIPVPRATSFYDSSESIKPIANLLDPLKYTMGKVFDSGPSSTLDLVYVSDAPNGLKILNNSNPWLTLFRNSTMPALSFTQDLINQRYQNIQVGSYNRAYTGFIPEFVIGLRRGAVADDPPAQIEYHDVDHVFPGILKSVKQQLMMVPIDFYECSETAPLNYIAGDDYLRTIFNGVEDCKFEHSNFSAPAAFDTSEAEGITISPLPPINMIDTTAFLTKNQNYIPVLTVSDPDSGTADEFYKVQDHKRDNTNSIYRDLLNLSADHVFITNTGDEIIFQGQLETSCPQKTVSEFYPASRVSHISGFENRMFVESLDPNSLSQRSWIERYTDSYTKVNFKLSETALVPPHIRDDDNPSNRSLVDLIVDLELDTLMLSYLRASFRSLTPSDGPSLREQSKTETHLYTHFLDSSIDVGVEGQDANFARSFAGLNERISSGFVPNKIKNVFLGMHEWINSFIQDIERENPLSPSERNFIELHLNRDEYPLLNDLDHSFIYPILENIEENKEVLLEILYRTLEKIKNAMSILGSSTGSTIDPELNVFGNGRTIKAMHLPIDQDPCYSEILAFRIEKSDADTGKVIKEFYLWNDRSSSDFSFYDAQVSIGSRYVYNIYAINFVAAKEYRYSNVKTPDRADLDHFLRPNSAGLDLPPERKILPEINFTSTVSPVYSVVETPLYSKEVTPLNLPPLYPDVSLYRHSQEEGRHDFRFELSSRLGFEREVPVTLFPEDIEIVEKMTNAQSKISTPEQEMNSLQFGSDTLPTGFQIIILDTAPTDIQDFRFGTKFETADAHTSFVFTATPNEDRFIIFRAHDIAGQSNPSPVYRFRFSEYPDGNYFEFDIYEIPLQTRQDRMTCQKLLSIEPSTHQLMYNLSNEDDLLVEYQNLENVDTLMSSAPDLTSDIIGPLDETSLWDKKFKVRLVSMNTQRAVDINFNFTLQRIDQVPSLQIFGITEQDNLTQECLSDKRKDLISLNTRERQISSQKLSDVRNQNLDCNEE